MEAVPVDVINLENWHYSVVMGGGTDSWRLTGEVYGHPKFPPGHRVFVSTPKMFDQKTL